LMSLFWKYSNEAPAAGGASLSIWAKEK